MARTYSKRITLKCGHCDLPRSAYWWTGDSSEEWNAKTIAEVCEGCSNTSTRWEFVTDSGTRLAARSTQGKAVVYVLPDGDFMSADPSSPEMVATAAASGVRREFGSLKDLRDFTRERARQKVEEWKKSADEGAYGVATPTYQQWKDLEYKACHNDALDWDEKSIQDRQGMQFEEMALRREQHEATMRRFRPARDGSIQLKDGSRMRIGNASDAKRYERLKGRR